MRNRGLQNSTTVRPTITNNTKKYGTTTTWPDTGWSCCKLVTVLSTFTMLLHHNYILITPSMKIMHSSKFYQGTFFLSVFIKGIWGAEYMHEYSYYIIILLSTSTTISFNLPICQSFVCKFIKETCDRVQRCKFLNILHIAHERQNALCSLLSLSYRMHFRTMKKTSSTILDVWEPSSMASIATAFFTLSSIKYRSSSR